MKAMRVLRFVFLGVGLVITGLGISMITGNIEGNPIAVVFGVILMVSFGAGLIAIGGTLLILSIVFFIVYGVKSKQQKPVAKESNKSNE